MPLEIQELIVRVRVEEEPRRTPGLAEQEAVKGLQEEIVERCVAEVMDLIKSRSER